MEINMNADVFARNGLARINGGVLHLGAHQAEELDFYERHGASWVVWVEADPDRWPDLRRKLPAHHELMECAVSDREGEATFFRYTHDDNNSFFPPGTDMPACVQPESVCTVRTTTIDAMLDRCPRLAQCRLLTMDVQGAELKALAGAARFLALPSLTHIYTEVIWAKYYVGCVTYDEYLDFLKGHGFGLIDRDEEGGPDWGNLLFGR